LALPSTAFRPARTTAWSSISATLMIASLTPPSGHW
jgi:hypothetical protein